MQKWTARLDLLTFTNASTSAGRRRVAGAVVLLALLACKAEKPLVDKPLADVTQDDLKGAIKSLGLNFQTCQSFKSGGSSNFGCTGDKESEKGKAGSDGKKRVEVTLTVFTVPADQAEAEQSRLRSKGPIEAAGGRVFAVTIEPEGADDPKAYLKKVRGK